MVYTPNKALSSILRPAFKPCAGFDGACKDVAQWKPECGHVPRGFVGALGSIDEVEVVLLIAEPGNPYQWEKYSPSRNTFSQVSQHTYRQLEGSDEQFHRNLRYMLDLLFPRMALQDQLRKTWITETYLCSAPQEAGPVPGNAENECASRYLSRQLDLLGGRPVIALGAKAYNRAKRVGVRDLFKAYAVAPPGCNRREARPSWIVAAKWARSKIREARRNRE